MSADPALSPFLLNRIAERLAEHQIAHADLCEGQPRLNLNAADGRAVFVKVNRAGERSGRAARELAGARWAHHHHLAVPTALVPHVMEVADENEEVRDLTVWRWLTEATAPALYDQARAMSDLLVRVASLPVPHQVSEFDLGYFHDRIHERLDGRSGRPAQRILNAADASASVIAGLLDPARYAWIHGDLHFENLLWQVNGSPMLLDWESHVRGPVEFDIAQILRSVHLDFPRHARSEKERAVEVLGVWVGAHLDIDWALVAHFGRFRAASSASHRLLHGQAPEKQRVDMDMLDTLPFRCGPART